MPYTNRNPRIIPFHIDCYRYRLLNLQANSAIPEPAMNIIVFLTLRFAVDPNPGNRPLSLIITASRVLPCLELLTFRQVTVICRSIIFSHVSSQSGYVSRKRREPRPDKDATFGSDEAVHHTVKVGVQILQIRN